MLKYSIIGKFREVLALKKLLLYIIVFCMLFSAVPTVSAQEDLDEIIAETAEYIQSTVKNPQPGAVGGEWTVFALARSGADVDDEYYQKYYNNVENYVKERQGNLSDRKYTEYSRLVIALPAIGKAPADIAGYNIVSPLDDYEKVMAQGINGAAWALIARGDSNYDMYADYILENRLSDGGWAISPSAETSDPDMTAMAIIALLPYHRYDKVYEAIETAINTLSVLQNADGGFTSMGEENSESTAQVITAICEVGISIDDDRFVKNGNTLLDNFLSYRVDGGFAHTKGGKADLMATEQALYALSALKRAENGMNTLFDLSDHITIDGTSPAFGLPGIYADIVYKEVIARGKTFSDIKGHENQAAIEALTARGIINGKSDTEFDPQANMTRAEFAAIIVKALGLSGQIKNLFADVVESDWYCDYINTASAYGIVNGISADKFNPNGTITREEAAVMLARAAQMCGMEAVISESATRDILAVFSDYMTVSDWAKPQMAACYLNGIADGSALEIKPKEHVTRAEIAQMLFNMMERAKLL